MMSTKSQIIHVVLLLALFVCYFVQVKADVVTYKNHYLYSPRPEYLIIPKYAKKDAPNSSPGNGRSFIDLSRFNFDLDCDKTHFTAGTIPDDGTCKESYIDILIFEAPTDKPWTDYWPNEDYCCTEEAVENNNCESAQMGSLIVPPTIANYYIESFLISPDAKTYIHGSTIAKQTISDSGLYVLILGSCEKSTMPIIINGKLESMDPYGYLPADLFGNLPFYAVLYGLYIVLGLIWTYVCFNFSSEMIPVQYWITAVLAVGMFETGVLYSHFEHWNLRGSPSLELISIGLFFGVAKRCFSRIVVQLISLGYGVVRPSIGEDMQRLVYLSSTYFLLSLAYSFGSSIPSSSKAVDNQNNDLLSLLLFFIAAIDTTFYIWTITSINNVLITLAAKKQAHKYFLYRNFRAVLFISLFCTAVWALFGSIVFFDTSKGANGTWQYRWSVDALWEFTYFAVFVAMCVLFAPSKNSQRYSYSIELSQLEDDEEYQESISSHGGSPLKSSDHDAGDSALDNEYGGRLDDSSDPFSAKGGASVAISKNN